MKAIACTKYFIFYDIYSGRAQSFTKFNFMNFIKIQNYFSYIANYDKFRVNSKPYKWNCESHPIEPSTAIFCK
jgi:hypothetical protein